MATKATSENMIQVPFFSQIKLALIGETWNSFGGGHFHRVLVSTGLTSLLVVVVVVFTRCTTDHN